MTLRRSKMTKYSVTCCRTNCRRSKITAMRMSSDDRPYIHCGRPFSDVDGPAPSAVGGVNYNNPPDHMCIVTSLTSISNIILSRFTLNRSSQVSTCSDGRSHHSFRLMHFATQWTKKTKKGSLLADSTKYLLKCYINN